MKYASGYQVGARFTENLSDYWTANLDYSFANQPLTFTNLTPDIPSLSLSHSIHDFSYGVTYQALSYRSRFRPYGKLGAGAALFYIHGSSKDEASELGVRLRDSWKFAVAAGGGFKYLIDEEVALTFDVRDYISGIPSYGLPSTARIVDGQFQPGFARSGFLNNWQINLGITFLWDDW
jgi:opacity protein-like surface antigen